MRADLKERVQSYFGEINKEIDLSGINFQVNIDSVVQANAKTEIMLDRIIRDGGKNKDQDLMDLGITEDMSATLRKSKLLN